MIPKAELMKRKREADRKAGRRNVTTPLPETVIADIDNERLTRRLMTRGDAIAAIVAEWKDMKSEREQATT